MTLLTLKNQDPSLPEYFQNGIGKVLNDRTAGIGICYFYVTEARALIISPLAPVIIDRSV